jgi:2'-5' RNA ligase
LASLRLFIAIEIPPVIKSQIAFVINELKVSNADVRWEQLEKLHLTLKFFGDTKEELLPQMVLLLEKVAAQTSSFSLRYSGIGCFPNKREPKVIWVGAEEPNTILQTLIESLETSLASLGFEREKRRFHPHATIGRVKSQRNIGDLLRKMESTTLDCQPTEVSQIVLITSELKPSGSEYATLKKFPLSTNKNLN